MRSNRDLDTSESMRDFIQFNQMPWEPYVRLTARPPSAFPTLHRITPPVWVSHRVKGCKHRCEYVPHFPLGLLDRGYLSHLMLVKDRAGYNHHVYTRHRRHDLLWVFKASNHSTVYNIPSVYLLSVGVTAKSPSCAIGPTCSIRLTKLGS